MARKTKRVTFTLTDEGIAAIEKIVARSERNKSQIVELLVRYEAATRTPILQAVKK